MMLNLAFTEIQEEEFELEDREGCSEIQEAVFNMWFDTVIKKYNYAKLINKESLSLKEINFIKYNNLEKSIDCCYVLLQKYTFYDVDTQIDMILSALNYLSSMRIPKEYAGGFLILLCKYHFLP